MGPEDSEENLRDFLMNASRKSSRIFEIFRTKEKSDHLGASRNRWLEYQGQRVAQQERSQSDLDMNFEERPVKASPCPKG